MDDAERSLANALKEGYRRAKTEAGYNATYFCRCCPKPARPRRPDG